MELDAGSLWWFTFNNGHAQPRVAALHVTPFPFSATTATPASSLSSTHVSSHHASSPQAIQRTH